MQSLAHNKKQFNNEIATQFFWGNLEQFCLWAWSGLRYAQQWDVLHLTGKVLM